MRNINKKERNMSTTTETLQKDIKIALAKGDCDAIIELTNKLKDETEKEREAGAAKFRQDNSSALKDFAESLMSARSHDELQVAFNDLGNAFNLKCERKETKKTWYIQNGKVFYEVGEGEDKKLVEIKEVRKRGDGRLQVVLTAECGIQGAPPMVHKVEDATIRAALEKLPRAVGAVG